MTLSKIKMIATVAALAGGIALGLTGEAFAGKGNGRDGGPGNGNGHGQGVGGGQGHAVAADAVDTTEDPSVEQDDTAHPSDLGSLNAAHASPNALSNADINSQPGKLEAYENETGDLEDAANKEVTQEVIDAVHALLGDEEEAETPAETPDEGTPPTDTVDDGTTPPPASEPEPTDVTTVE